MSALPHNSATFESLAAGGHRSPSKVPDGIWLTYILMGRIAQDLPSKWEGIPYQERLELREVADAMDGFRAKMESMSLGQWLAMARSPIVAFEAFLFARRSVVVIAAIRRLAAQEDRRASEVVRRFEEAGPQPHSGEYLTLSADQIRARSW